MKGTHRLLATRQLVSGDSTIIPKALPHPTVQDWAHVVAFTPRLYFKPHDLDELKRFIAGAIQGLIPANPIRVLGGLHSCSEICVSDTIVDTSDLDKTIEFSADNSVVTVSANWTLHEFLAALSAKGKSINATGGTDAQTLAGIISTNTAPATPSRSIYELVNWIEYVTIDPNTNAVVERRVTRTDADFAALVTSLGAIGVITKVQFRLVDELFYSVVMKVIPMKEALDDLQATSSRYTFWRVNWLPASQKALLWAATEVPPDQAEPDGDYAEDQAESVLKFIFMLWDKVTVGAAGPLLDPTMRAVYRLMAAFYNLNPVTKLVSSLLDRIHSIHGSVECQK